MIQVVRKIQRYADTNVRFLSSRSAWDTARLGPGVVEMVISGLSPTQLISRQPLNYFEMF